MCPLSVINTCLSFEPELEVLARLYHVILTSGPPPSWRWLAGEHHGAGVPPAQACGQMAENETTSSAIRLQKPELQLQVEDKDCVKQQSVDGGKHRKLMFS